MRTSGLLPEECREEIRAKYDRENCLAEDEYDNAMAIGFLRGLDWVLGDDNSKPDDAPDRVDEYQ